MAEVKGRDHARINLDLWGDDDWMDLPVDAQMLYMTLYTSPDLSYCGAGEWHPGRIAARASDWTVGRVEAAAAVLSRELFLLIDISTGEFLLRSWVKHDGLWRTPNMAVSVAIARAKLASRGLRGVVVHEVVKLKKKHPDASGWVRDAVQKMLSQRAVDPASLEPFTPSCNPAPDPDPNGGGKGGGNPYGHHGPNPGANPGPTPAPTPSSYSIRGYVSTEGYVANPRRCPSHQHHPNPPNCHHCAVAREAVEADELRERRAKREAEAKALQDCRLCDDKGWLLGDDGTPADPATPCHHREVRHA